MDGMGYLVVNSSGDPKKVILLGNSAGAHLASMSFFCTAREVVDLLLFFFGVWKKVN